VDSTSTTAAGDTDELSDDHDSADDIGSPKAGFKPGTAFDDHKAPGAFRTIGEVARALGIRQHVLRYWEEQFPMLTPVKRSGNRRYYRPEDVVLIETIDRLVHHEGYTLRGARLALEPLQKKAKRAPGAVPKEPEPAETARVVAADPPATAPWLDELLAIRATLAAALVD
jgi:DNA-binding transcriptional MerR regulator